MTAHWSALSNAPLLNVLWANLGFALVASAATYSRERRWRRCVTSTLVAAAVLVLGGVVALAKLRWRVCRRTRRQPPCETFLLGCTCSEMKALRCSLQSRAAVVSMNGGTKSMKSSGSSW